MKLTDYKAFRIALFLIWRFKDTIEGGSTEVIANINTINLYLGYSPFTIRNSIKTRTDIFDRQGLSQWVTLNTSFVEEFKQQAYSIDWTAEAIDYIALAETNGNHNNRAVLNSIIDWNSEHPMTSIGVTDIRAVTGIHNRLIWDSLESLENLGFISLKPTKARRYIIDVDFDRVISAVNSVDFDRKLKNVINMNKCASFAKRTLKDVSDLKVESFLHRDRRDEIHRIIVRKKAEVEYFRLTHPYEEQTRWTFHNSRSLVSFITRVKMSTKPIFDGIKRAKFDYDGQKMSLDDMWHFFRNNRLSQTVEVCV